MAKQQSRAQVTVDTFDGMVSRPTPLPGVSYTTYRQMRKEPTIGLARDLSVAPAMFEPWTVEMANDEEVTLAAAARAREFIRRFHDELIRTAMYAHADFGWKAYEIAYRLDDEGYVVVDRILPLLNDNTWQLRDKDTNEFLGLKHTDIENGNEFYIDKEHSLFINFDDEGVGKYAEPLAVRAYESYCQWQNANDGADRYDQKVAGAFMVVKYPVGQSPYSKTTSAEPVMTDNAEIADDIATALKASGYTTIPINIKEDDMTGESQTLESWSVEVVSAGGAQADFVTRLKYHDARMVRAYAIPERSILEGSLGTKAEAETHGDIAMVIAHLNHRRVVEEAQKIIDYLNKLNADLKPGTVTLRIGDMDGERRKALSGVFEKFMADAIIGPEIAERVDVEALMEGAGIPTVSDFDENDLDRPIKPQPAEPVEEEEEEENDADSLTEDEGEG